MNFLCNSIALLINELKISIPLAKQLWHNINYYVDCPENKSFS
jgi:hypothetical protein